MRGAFAGVVAGLVLILVQLALRATLGVSPPPEAIPDRFAPTLSIAQFFRLLDLFGGYDQLKQFGVGSILTGELVVALLVGIVYARIRRTGHVPALQALALFVVAAVVVSTVVLWPVLGANYRGSPAAISMWLSAAALVAGYGAYGLTLAWLDPGRTERATPASRRALLRLGIASVVLGVATVASLRNLFASATFDYDGLEYRDADLAPIVPVDRFYSVTKNVIDPEIDRSWWRLAVGGLVERPVTLTYNDLVALPGAMQETTLMCISNYVGGGLISNAVWNGVPLRQILDSVRPRADAVELVVHGADGYSDTISIAKALDGSGFVAYGMNDASLPARHGGPVRLLVPGRFGEKSVKWLTAIEVVGHDVQGFYEQQGWGPTFVVPTRSQFSVPSIDTVRAGDRIELRGWAFGGDRGISRVEVSTDGGRDWRAATIDYAGTSLTWTLWRSTWQPTQPGVFRLVVRAVDGHGQPQTDVYRDTTPDGATGYHAIEARVT